MDGGDAPTWERVEEAPAALVEGMGLAVVELEEAMAVPAVGMEGVRGAA
jgi:hypothetical protein